MAPPDERIVPLLEHALVVPCFVADEGRLWQSAFVAALFRGSPAARGVSGIGRRAQGF